jgi:nucleoside-diphosphate-sugar epimerase
MPHTLVTGANGFVAAHVVDQLIAAGHHVTGSVRTIAKGTELVTVHPEYEGKIDFVTISDYAKDGVWDDVFEKGDFDYVVHVAAPLLDNPKNTDYVRDFATPSVEG